jgi:hypothetical protein
MRSHVVTVAALAVAVAEAVMQRELTYHVPFERLVKLSRSAGYKMNPHVRWMVWLLIALVIPVLTFLYAFSDEIRDVGEDEGIPFAAELLFIGVILIFIVGLRLLRRYQVRLMKDRINFDQIVRLNQDNGGVRLTTDSVEYYLKWPGVTQLLLERDGVVLSHGNLLFLVPNTAFTSTEERLSFIREIYGHLSEKARAISEKHIQPALGPAPGPARAS